MKLRTGFTMIELMVILILVGILTTITIEYSLQTKEQAADKEAINNLILLSSAQQNYRLDNDSYFNSSDVSNDQGAIYRELRVMISNNTNRLWNYTTKSDGCVQARRFGGSKNWSLTIADSDGKPNSGACP